MKLHGSTVEHLTPEDYQQIEEEHSKLHEVLTNLRSICCNLDNQLSCQVCSREKLASCQGQINSIFYNLTNLSENHFRHEEVIILKGVHATRKYEHFLDHRKAHLTIMNDLLEEMDRKSDLAERPAETAARFRHLHKKISHLFEEHARLFDDPFIQASKTG
jgi:hypothetical protein